MGNFHQPIPGEGSKVDPHFVSLHYYLHVLEKVQILNRNLVHVYNYQFILNIFMLIHVSSGIFLKD